MRWEDYDPFPLEVLSDDDLDQLVDRMAGSDFGSAMAAAGMLENVMDALGVEGGPWDYAESRRVRRRLNRVAGIVETYRSLNKVVTYDTDSLEITIKAIETAGIKDLYIKGKVTV